MRAFWIPALLAASFATFLRADTRTVIKTTVAGHETVSAQYRQGKNTRIEDVSRDGSRQSVRIYNSEPNRMYVLDLPSRTYVESQLQSPDWMVSLAMWIARPSHARESGKTVNVYYETIDTGERKTFFGRTARHLLLRTRRVAEPGACSSTYQIEKDGWYIPPIESATAKGATLTVSYLVGMYPITGFGNCRDTVVRHGDLSLPGFPVLETEGSITREVMELSNDPLDKGLFEAPGNFRKVEALPGVQQISWSQRMAMEWSQLERAFESWFE